MRRATNATAHASVVLLVTASVLAGCASVPCGYQACYGAHGSWIAEFEGPLDRDNASAALKALDVDVVDENAVWVRGDYGDLHLMLDPDMSSEGWRFIGSVSVEYGARSADEALARLQDVRQTHAPVFMELLTGYENETGAHHVGNVTWDGGVVTT